MVMASHFEFRKFGYVNSIGEDTRWGGEMGGCEFLEFSTEATSNHDSRGAPKPLGTLRLSRRFVGNDKGQRDHFTPAKASATFSV